MDKLVSMKVFARVAKLGGFSVAASDLGISKAMASKHITALENTLGVRLLNRTTRKISLTEVGAAYRERVNVILAEIEETELSVSHLNTQPTGTLKMMAPTSFGAFHLSRAAADFMEEYPDISVELILTDREADLAEEGLDLSINVGELSDSSLIARKIASTRMVVCASPDYLAENGIPKIPEELVEHKCLLFTPRFPSNEWQFRRGGEDFSIKVSGCMKSNVGDTLRVGGIKGLGIIQQPTYMIGQDIKLGRLKVILEEYEPAQRPIHVMYLHRRHLSAKVRMFVEFLIDRFQPIPYWDEWTA
ncbi:MAG: LysR family transcriptional regulator [Gammaproteobacteria bacterium]